jgi:hypothetical protein
MPTPTVSLFHNAYFYESNEFPENPIAEFLHEGLAAGENAVVVTSLGHISRIEDELNRLGVRLGPSSKKAWSVVDTSSAADALLSGHPVESVTGRFIAPAVRYARENSLTGRVRIYGDLADLMLRLDKPDIALALEQYGNQIAGDGTTKVYCGYSGESFPDATFARHFTRICLLHDRTHVDFKDRSDWRFRLAEGIERTRSGDVV